MKICHLVEGVDLRYDDQKRIVIMNNSVIRLSPRQWKIMRLLLTKQIVTDEMCCQALNLPKLDLSALRLLTKHVEKIRCRLAPHGLTIGRVHGYGYVLFCVEEKA